VQLKRIQIPFTSADGKTAGVIIADSAEGDLKAGTAALKNVSLRAKRAGKPEVTSVAPFATVRAKDRTIEMRGGVTFEVPGDKASISAQRITWNWQTGDYVGSGNVHIRMNGGEGKGGKVVGNTKTGHVALEG